MVKVQWFAIGIAVGKTSIMIHIITIVLDGMPFIAAQWAAINRIRDVDWRWHVSHGVADNVGCTSWCKHISPRLSNDGTTEFLNGLKSNKRVRIYEKPMWNGKLEMVNAGVSELKPEDIVIQMDSDELWTSRQLEMIHQILDVDEKRNAAMFRCRYFVGPSIVIQGYDTYGNHTSYEWKRAWKVGNSGFMFTKHEPPCTTLPEVWIGHNETESIGLVFDHYAYALEKQVSFKEHYYGYKGAVQQWKSLQSQTSWPCTLRKYLQWVKDGAVATTL